MPIQFRVHFTGEKLGKPAWQQNKWLEIQIETEARDDYTVRNLHTVYFTLCVR